MTYIIYVFSGSISLSLHSLLTWKCLIAFAAFHCAASPSVTVSFQILITRTPNSLCKRCWWKHLILKCFRITQKILEYGLFLFWIMLFREYDFHLLSWPTKLIPGILLRTGLMYSCPLESRLRPTNPFCSCHKLTLNPGVLM